MSPDLCRSLDFWHFHAAAEATWLNGWSSSYYCRLVLTKTLARVEVTLNYLPRSDTSHPSARRGAARRGLLRGPRGRKFAVARSVGRRCLYWRGVCYRSAAPRRRQFIEELHSIDVCWLQPDAAPALLNDSDRSLLFRPVRTRCLPREIFFPRCDLYCRRNLPNS